ncbi:hypothetical protein EJB05_01448, partial [Eragrostis curvula]
MGSLCDLHGCLHQSRPSPSPLDPPALILLQSPDAGGGAPGGSRRRARRGHPPRFLGCLHQLFLAPTRCGVADPLFCSSSSSPIQLQVAELCLSNTIWILSFNAESLLLFPEVEACTGNVLSSIVFVLETDGLFIHCKKNGSMKKEIEMKNMRQDEPLACSEMDMDEPHTWDNVCVVGPATSIKPAKGTSSTRRLPGWREGVFKSVVAKPTWKLQVERRDRIADGTLVITCFPPPINMEGGDPVMTSVFRTASQRRFIYSVQISLVVSNPFAQHRGRKRASVLNTTTRTFQEGFAEEPEDDWEPRGLRQEAIKTQEHPKTFAQSKTLSTHRWRASLSPSWTFDSPTKKYPLYTEYCGPLTENLKLKMRLSMRSKATKFKHGGSDCT